MYLINVSTLVLERFESNIPSYAILSHTWGSPDEEVTFRDIVSSSSGYTKKAGYEKIQHCAAEAQKDKLQYCWVDTCCIDKSSSAELSEAINSMYTWYNNSAVCYVYLVDVNSQLSGYKSQFASSRWFSRGWTLQELIAPNNLQFYDVNWSQLGSIVRGVYQSSLVNYGFTVQKSMTSESDINQPWLTNIIQRSTGIGEGILLLGTWHMCSIGMKMSWASKRKTTRREDMAYCLMGLFDVNMPLLYGEGDKAFIRLQEEILKKTPDHTLFAWSGGTDLSLNGLLSPSPAYYSWIRRDDRGFPRQIEKTSTHMLGSYQMTNNGLHIQVLLIPVSETPHEYYAAVALSGRWTFCIKLRELNSTHQFARVDVQEEFWRLPGEFNHGTPKWIYVRQSMEGLRITFPYHRLSKLILSNKVESVVWVDMITDNPVEQGGVVLPVHQGASITARIILVVHSIFLEIFTIGWLIETREANEISSRFAYIRPPSREAVMRSDVDWQERIRLGDTPITSKINFTVLRGEIVAEIKIVNDVYPIILRN